MPIFFKFFFTLYNFFWYIALFFLRHNKRLKDGWEQRNIPMDWLAQNLVVFNNTLIELEQDKPFFGEKRQKEEFEPAHEFDADKELEANKEFESGEEFEDEVDLWIQAASGGESYLACEFIKALPPNSRAMSILITTWTRQGMQVLEKECVKIIENWKEEAYKNQDGKQACPIPYIQIRFAAFDRIDIVRRALDMANPRLCIMLETELWPNFMLACKDKEIPLYVVNARMTQTSYEFYKIIASILDFITPKQILATSKDDMTRFSEIFPSALVSYMPNIKFDRAAKNVHDYIANMGEKDTINHDNHDMTMHPINGTHPINGEKIIHQTFENQFAIEQENPRKQEISVLNEYPKKESTFLNGLINPQANYENKAYLDVLPMLFSKAENTFLFASVREQEENLLASVLWKVYRVKKNSLFIIVPRHMHRVQAWKSRFYDLGMSVVLASEFLQEKQEASKFETNEFEANEFETFEGHSCVVWDIFGDLPFLYSHADNVFVGGSFKGLGGQNFLEALSCGIVPHVGPCLNNFLWALGDDFPPSLKNIGLLHQHESKRELQAALLGVKNAKQNAKERFDIQTRFLEWMEPRCGASKLAVEKVLADRAFRDFTMQFDLLNEENE